MAKRKSTSDKGDGTFEAAIEAAQEAQHDDAAWDALEQLADDEQRPDEVAAAYREVLERGLSKTIAPKIADRAVKFCQAWFVDTPEAMPTLLSQIVERYPAIDWAFERLVVLFTSDANWSDLLALYDRTLGETRDEKKRRKLLNDAANLAKDFADEPDRAADYLQQLLTLEPGNDKLVVALERLLERGKRYPELLTLWRDQLPSMATEQARATRSRIAAISLDQLNAPERAVAELRELIEESPGHPDACAQLERILQLEDAPDATRREALSLLRKTYEIVRKPEDVIRVLEHALTFVQGDDARSLRRECGNRLALLGNESDAMGHFAVLLKDAADDGDARKQLRVLARRSERRDLQVSALLAAAEACEDTGDQAALWLEAAGVRHQALDDVSGAIELYQQVVGVAEADPAHANKAAHQLNELLHKADRGAERLPILERLSALEQAPSFKRQILAEAARLAEQLGDRERALQNWRHILQVDERDLEALSASIQLLTQLELYDELIEGLRQRADSPVSSQQRRADFVRIAETQATLLEQPSAAIDSWLAIREEFGEDAECLRALEQLLTGEERFQELGALLSGAIARELGDTAGHVLRLADLYREHLEQPAEALRLYQQALALNPADEAAQRGCRALLELPDLAATAADALVRAFEQTDDWERQLELVDARLDAADSGAAQAEILDQAAKLHKERAGDEEAATLALRRALPLDPRRLDLRAELLQLAGANGGWQLAADALREASAAATADPRSAAELRRLEGRINEEQLGDWAAAFDAHLAASVLLPDDAPTLAEVARCAARAGRYDAAATATVGHARVVMRAEPTVLTALEEAAEDNGGWSELAASMSSALAEQNGLASAVAAELHGHVADWQHARCDEVEAAKKAALRAIELAPTNVAALERIVRLQRSAPGAELLDTLLRVDKAGDERNLDALHEAGEVALTHDEERAAEVLEKLYRKATGLWLSSSEHRGERTPAESAEWALQALTGRLVEAKEHARAARLLLNAGELPWPAEQRAAINRRAAEQLLACEARVPAIDAYRRVLADAPDDFDTIRTLAGLCEEEEGVSGSAALRERELQLTDDKQERLELRLANSKRAAELEAKSGRVSSLLANLDEEPGHPPSVEAIYEILDERGKQAQLATILEEQATTLATAEDNEGSAALWSRLAEVAERKLQDQARAIAAHQRVVELTEAPRALDALARLHLDQDQPAEASTWLKRRLETAGPTERVPVLLKLARTHLKAGREPDAITTLQTAFDEAPQSAEVRKLLIPLLRQREDWPALAKTLAVSVEYASDDTTVLAYAREAANLFYTHLDASGKAVPVLRRAVELAPEDRKLRSMLGDGLRVVGELDEARELLTQLIEDFGRRGSQQRAEVHMQLAKVLHAQDSHEEALAQLDIASKMDADNVDILRTLAEQARAAGQLQRAEAALRALLLTARRLTADGSTDVPIGPSEVLFELSSIASARGQSEQAEELAESAIETLHDSEGHSARLQAKLRDKGEFVLLLRLLEARLNYISSPFRRGQIIGERAEVLMKLERPEEAFDARLEAIDADPGSPLLHEGTRELAVSLGTVDRLTEHLEVVLERARRDTDAMIRCEVLLRLGQIAESEQQDYERASQLFDQAEATGVREADVLRARARVAGARGDEEEQMRLLNQLASLGEDQVESRANALYRIAEVQLAADDSLEEGIASLRKALADHPRAERACTILRRATEQHSDNDVLLDAYEQVARDSGDDNVLLNYLERRSMHPSATTDIVQEAVSRALAIGEADRAEALMQRAVDLSRDDIGGMHAVDWALLGLAERCKDRGDVEAAVQWLEEAGEVADPEPLFRLSREVADLAAANDNPQAAATLYEKLRERDPTARDAWQPLIDIYERLQDVDGLERVVRETLDSLQEVGDRNTLRISLSRALLSDEERIEDAIQVLREALFDEPGHEEALGMLSDSLEKAGKTEDLIELLRDQLIGAQDRGDAAFVKATALRLGPMLDQDDAVGVFQDALQLGDDEQILEALIAAMGQDHDPGERAATSERLLALKDGDEAAALARELADAYQQQEDATGQLRVLEMGLERAPDDEAIRERLEAHYREQGDAGGLANILRSTAEQCENVDRKVTLLREAAAVYRDQLGDMASAVDMLSNARANAPQDADLAVELANTMVRADDAAGALTLLGEAIEAADGDAASLSLLTARALVRTDAGDEAGAVEDLERGYEIEPDAVSSELLAALERQRNRAREDADTDGERSTIMRSVQVHMELDDRAAAMELLTDWSDDHLDDLDALHQLRDLQADDQNWEELARTCARLVEVEEGDEQVDSAGLLLEACVQLGVPDQAREPLERAWAQQPDSARMRGEVRRVYEMTGANQELAKLLLEEASTLDDTDDKVAHLRWAGEVLLNAGDIEAALPALGEVLEIVPDDAKARCLVADAHVVLGRYDEAHGLLDEAIAGSRRNSPDLHMFHHRKAYVCHSQGDHAAQLDSLKRAHQHARKNGQIAAELANLAEALEQWDLAVATLRSITTLDDDCPIAPAVALVRQGRIAMRLGDEKRARLCARRAAMTSAEDPEVVAFLEELGEG